MKTTAYIRCGVAAMALLGVAVMIARPAFAQEDKAADSSFFPGSFSANVGLVSDYVFRGVTQADEGPALQGGFDYTLPVTGSSNVYLGIWGSNVDFNDGDEANIEIDWYGGANTTIGPWTLDAGLLYYTYPSANDNLEYDYVELQGKVTYDFDVVALTGSVNYSPDNFAGSGDAWYEKLAVTAPLPYDISANAYVGHQSVQDNAAFALPDYTDWGAGLGYNFKGLDFSANYIDTNLNSDCADGCGARVVLGVSKKF